MSIAAFLDQYHATGRVRGDGYDAAMFAGMSVGERTAARAMLCARALTGDGVDLHGLRFVGDDVVVAALRVAGAGGMAGGAMADIQRLETLFCLTGDVADAMALLAHVDGGTAPVRDRAAWALASLSLDGILAAPIASRLVRFRYRAVALPLATAWLTTQGVPVQGAADFQTRLPMIRHILGTRRGRRMAVLEAIARTLRVP